MSEARTGTAAAQATARPEVDIRPADPVLGEIVAGLRDDPKTISSKFFYDARGAALFERICDLPEYYVTRAELAILRRHAADIARLAGPGAALVEYGSGAGVKVRLLLDALESPSAYVAIDVSREQLMHVTEELRAAYPGLAVDSVLGDFGGDLDLPPVPGARKLAFFPGSTIGNFDAPAAGAFLRRIRDAVGSGGGLVLGVDRVKDVDVLLAAYDDSQGVTAAFNLNVLERLNREFGATFDVSRFAHRVRWVPEHARIEMHLESLDDQEVLVGGTRVSLRRGETVWTENSHKYDEARLDALAADGGWLVRQRWTDPEERFWVVFLEPATA